MRTAPQDPGDSLDALTWHSEVADGQAWDHSGLSRHADHDSILRCVEDIALLSEGTAIRHEGISRANHVSGSHVKLQKTTGLGPHPERPIHDGAEERRFRHALHEAQFDQNIANSSDAVSDH